MLDVHKERLYKCQAARHNLPRVEQQNKEESEAFEKRKRDEVFRYDKQVVEKLDAKVRTCLYRILVTINLSHVH